jgi:hypothetical protein
MVRLLPAVLGRSCRESQVRVAHLAAFAFALLSLGPGPSLKHPLDATDQAADRPVHGAVDALDDLADLVADAAEPDEVGQKRDGDWHQGGERALHAVGRRAGLPWAICAIISTTVWTTRQIRWMLSRRKQ